MSKSRDKIAHAVANWVLKTFATEEYQQRLEFTYVLGLEELERRLDENKTRATLGDENYKETR